MSNNSLFAYFILCIPVPISLSVLAEALLNQALRSINDVSRIPIELIRNKRDHDSVRKAREAHLMNKVTTLHPIGMDRRDEEGQ